MIRVIAASLLIWAALLGGAWLLWVSAGPWLPFVVVIAGACVLCAIWPRNDVAVVDTQGWLGDGRLERRTYRWLLGQRRHRLARLRALDAPACLVQNEKRLVRQAFLGCIWPFAARCWRNLQDRSDERQREKTRCQVRDGWARCLLTNQHSGEHCYRWPEEEEETE